MDGARPIVWNNCFCLFSFQRFCWKHTFLLVLTAFVFLILIGFWWPFQRFDCLWLVFDDPFGVVVVDFDWFLVTLSAFLLILIDFWGPYSLHCQSSSSEQAPGASLAPAPPRASAPARAGASTALNHFLQRPPHPEMEHHKQSFGSKLFLVQRPPPSLDEHHKQGL